MTIDCEWRESIVIIFQLKKIINFGCQRISIVLL